MTSAQVQTPDPQAQRRVLVCVAGTSPAILTETLFSLITQPVPWVPHEVHVVTTTEGRDALQRSLLDPVQGQFHQLLRDYSTCFAQGAPRLDEQTIHLISPRGQPGQTLKDIVTLDDNRAAAETVLRVLRQLKSVPGTQVHASVAGGRKSMSFYMGQAFSLLADESDVLSHVLVSWPFEKIPAFYYRPPQPVDLVYTDRDTKQSQTWNTSQAHIDLAVMSVLKLGPLLRKALPPAALDDLDEAMTLTQGLLAPFSASLLVRSDGGNDTGVIRLLGHEIELSPAHFCLLLLHAKAQQMRAAGTIGREDLKYSDSTLNKDDWNALGIACRLSRWKATQRPHLSAFSKLLRECQPVVGDVAQRLRIEATGRGGRYQLTAVAPHLDLSGLTKPHLHPLLEKIVWKMAA